MDGLVGMELGMVVAPDQTSTRQVQAREDEGVIHAIDHPDLPELWLIRGEDSTC